MKGNDRRDDNGKDDPIDGAIDVVETAVKALLDPDHPFGKGFVSGGQTDVNTPEPLREVHVKDDVVMIVAEVQEGEVDKIGVNFQPQAIEVMAGSESFTAELPDGVVRDTLDASVNNGVLTIKMDRDVQEDDSLEEFDAVEQVDGESSDEQGHRSTIEDMLDEGGDIDNDESKSDEGGDDNGVPE